MKLPDPSAAGRALHRLDTLRRIVESGLVAPTMPDRLVKAGVALWRFGPTPAAACVASAARYPDDLAVIDERGQITYRELHERTNALAHSLADQGLGEGDNVALLSRNHRGFVEATVACSKLGAHVLYLNTGFATPQIAEVVEREQAAAIIYDDEFAKTIGEAGRRDQRFIAWRGDVEEDLPEPTLDDLIAVGDPADVVAPTQQGRTTILTSGTTGTPKGATRAVSGLDPIGALLSKIPFRARSVTIDAPPMFHAWGFANFLLALAMTSTLVLRRKFDPKTALEDVARHQADALVMVPVMLQRMLDLDPRELSGYDIASLRVIALSGSALAPPLVVQGLDAFGDILYNLYGSTEVAWATIATPEDLRAAPGTAGKPPRGTILKLFDDDGDEVRCGDRGRIFVGNEMLFEGYTGGGSKDMIDGLMATGDVGHFDEHGRLFIDGRSDDMIVSGGENVFPSEIEDTIAGHPDVVEAAVIGVEDPKFGQRLKAFVVLREGARLSEDEVKEHVRGNLARYKVPREVEVLDELPRNATGKVLKRELQKREEEV
ncbi:MAG TPA: acyl-CoA synthetase [Solirubrobacteraceae bacterium]|jgi:fatty-acyl-CoA synthase|nr:acyl-CoA synthetase [Solirubrobacteraceae bacterium]